MSGYSSDATCPRCGDLMNTYSDHKPFPYESGDCLHCGFNYATQEGKRYTLKEVNSIRRDMDCKPLKKLSVQTWKEYA